jgi:NurA-like 5'-3' nuclease
MIYAVFKINQNEIIKTLCVQRKLPFNSCKGSCELKKNLKKLDANEKEMQNNLKEKIELIYIQNSIDNGISNIEHIDSQLIHFTHFSKKPISVTNSTFRPPTCLI